MADPLDPITFVHKIKAPVFMACQWEDEQTGGHCADLAQHFTGTHASGSRSPTAPTSTRSTRTRSTAGMTSCRCSSPTRRRRQPRRLSSSAAPLFYERVDGDQPTSTLPPDPIQQIPTYRAALAAFEKLPRCGCCSTTVPAPGRRGRSRLVTRTPPSSSRSRASRSRAPSRALVFRGRWHAGHQPRRGARG